MVHRRFLTAPCDVADISAQIEPQTQPRSSSFSGDRGSYSYSTSGAHPVSRVAGLVAVDLDDESRAGAVVEDNELH